MIEIKKENELGLKVFANAYPDLLSMTEEYFDGFRDFLNNY